VSKNRFLVAKFPIFGKNKQNFKTGNKYFKIGRIEKTRVCVGRVSAKEATAECA
jgi:hypothetical protein